MKLGVSNTIPNIVNLPGQGGGGAAAFSTKSLLFDGTTDEINCGNVTVLNGLSHGSWSFWLNSSVTGINGIFNQWGSGADALIYSWIELLSGRLDLYFDGSVKYRVTGNSIINALNTGEWFNLVIVFDGTIPNTGDQTGRLKVYINGDLLSDGFAFVTGPTAMPSTTSDLVLGHAFTFGSFWDGYMDEVGIWNSSLTQAAVTEIYNTGTPNDLNDLTNATNPSVWYRMGENATFKEPQILMLEQNNKDKVSNFSMAFDGTGDYVKVPTDSSIYPTTALSISMWVKLDVLDNPYTIAGGLSGGTGLTNGYAIQIYSASGLVYFRLGNGSANTLISGSISAGVWTHILCTYNGTNMQTWINGATDGSTTAVSSPIVYDTSKDLFIGTRYLWGSHILTGNIDEVAIWNSDQSANFATIYNSGKPADLTSLSPSAWWRMGEEAIFDPAATEWAIPDQAGSNDGVSANMDIYTRVGDAPNSPNNALSYNMDAAAIVEDTPPNP